MELRKRLRSGVYDGVEYVGEVIENNGAYTGTILEVPPSGHEGEFGYQDSKTFNNYEAASEYVRKEWVQKFGE
ncbi:MAG: hypothetical protein K0S39_917 [Paenibacillus sp.]|jgi:hypothetical protein|nr:hypothetical protein [Paenibacillus sp.]